MTTSTARRDILDSIGNTRDVLAQAAREGAALRGECGPEAQLLAMSELYKRLRAAGKVDEAKAIRERGIALIQALQQQQTEAQQQQEETPMENDADLPSTDLTIPPVADILDLVKERYDTARRHDDTPGARQLDRVRQNLLNGARLSWHLGDLLIQSVNTPGAVYSVNARGCTCPNGAAGRASCWHVALFDLLVDMQEETATTADMEADAAAEQAEREAAAALGRRLCAARSRVMECAA